MVRILITCCLFTFLLSSGIDALLFQPYGNYHVDRYIARQLKATPAKYKDLGGNVLADPGCLSRDGQVFHCFFATDDAAVGYAMIKDSKAEFQTFGGTVEGEAQMVGYGRNGVFALFLTLDKKIAVAAVKTETEFDDKVTVLDYGTFLEAPGCVLMGSEYDVFCVMRSTNGRMYAMRNSDHSWNKPYFVADNPGSPLGCGYNTATTRVHCWSTSNANIIAERLFTHEGYPQLPTWWEVNRSARGRVQVKMLRGAIPLPRALSYSKNEMVDNFASFGGNLMSEPDCVQASDDSVDCFALDTENGIQRNYQIMGLLYVRRTSGWVHYGGSFNGKPSCVFSQNDRKIHCFIRKDDNQLVEGLFAPEASGFVIAT